MHTNYLDYQVQLREHDHLQWQNLQFVLHKHNISKIDMVVCLVEDINLGIPIIQVKELIFKPKYRRVTLSLDDKTYHDFQKFCEDNDIIVSKRVERLMKEMLDDKKEKK